MKKEVSGAAAEVGKSVCLAAVVTLAAVLLFALVIKLFAVPSAVIMPVNQVIKVLAVFCGCFFCLRPERAALKGAIVGACAGVLTYFLFAIIAGEISFGWGNVLDLLCGALAGFLSGALCTLVRGK